MTHLPLSWPKSAESADFWVRLRAAPRSILMLDYDGTLAPFQKDRLQASPYPGVERRIAMLSRLPQVRLILVSGRPARELQAIFRSAGRIEIWGSHGREQLRRDGSYVLLPLDDAQRETLERVRAELSEMGFPDALEVKPASLAVHWRSFDPRKQEEIRSIVQSLHARHHGEGKLQLLPFDEGLELRAPDQTKGTAVRQILKEEASGTPAAYLGDDLTDEDAFQALGKRGLSILVRATPRRSSSRFWIEPPAELLQFLDRWVQASQIEESSFSYEEKAP